MYRCLEEGKEKTQNDYHEFIYIYTLYICKTFYKFPPARLLMIFFHHLQPCSDSTLYFVVLIANFLRPCLCACLWGSYVPFDFNRQIWNEFHAQHNNKYRDPYFCHTKIDTENCLPNKIRNFRHGIWIEWKIWARQFVHIVYIAYTRTI